MKQKILLVEDDQFLQQLYLDLLSQEHFEVELVADGTTALEKIRNDHWSLVLLDIMLPGITGLEIIETLKKDASFKKTFPIIFMTNLDESHQQKQLQEADGYIIKSNVSPPEFIEEVKKYLK